MVNLTSVNVSPAINNALLSRQKVRETTHLKEADIYSGSTLFIVIPLVSRIDSLPHNHGSGYWRSPECLQHCAWCRHNRSLCAMKRRPHSPGVPTFCAFCSWINWHMLLSSRYQK